MPRFKRLYEGVPCPRGIKCPSPGEQRSLDRALATLSNLDHFGDVNEMILDPLSAIETSYFRLPDDQLKVAVIGIPKTRAKPRLDQYSFPAGFTRLIFSNGDGSPSVGEWIVLSDIGGSLQG